jgi:hypothetical protein
MIPKLPIDKLLILLCLGLIIWLPPFLPEGFKPLKQQNTYREWLSRIDRFEIWWNSKQIDDYQISGHATWGWHGHSFQVTVVDGQIIDSVCKLEYDEFTGPGWCETEFEASDYIVPALFDKARAMVDFGQMMTKKYNEPQNCFRASFDFDTGAPTYLWLDCENANDEENEWIITISSIYP